MGPFLMPLTGVTLQNISKPHYYCLMTILHRVAAVNCNCIGNSKQPDILNDIMTSLTFCQNRQHVFGVSGSCGNFRKRGKTKKKQIGFTSHQVVVLRGCLKGAMMTCTQTLTISRLIPKGSRIGTNHSHTRKFHNGPHVSQKSNNPKRNGWVILYPPHSVRARSSALGQFPFWVEPQLDLF